MKQVSRLILLSFMMSLMIFSPIGNANEKITVEITGVEGEILSNVQGRVNAALEDSQVLNTAEDIRDLYHFIQHEINLAVEPFEYFKATVKSQLTKSQNGWQANYHVELGPAMKIVTVDTKLIGPGSHDPQLKKKLVKPLLKAGNAFSVKDYDETQENMLDTANESGYLKAHFVKHEIVIDMSQYQATIILHLDTGPLYYFGNLKFTKNPYRQSFIDRFLHIKSGQVYDSQKLNQLQNNLSNSPYFQLVSVTPQLNNKDKIHYVPITIHLTPRPKQNYTLGIGYGTDTKFRGTVSAEYPRITDTGHIFRTQFRVSQIQSNFSASYIIPGKNPLTDSYRLTAQFYNFSTPIGSSHNRQLGVAYVSVFGNWQQKISLNYLNERFQLNNLPKQTSNILSPSVIWSKTKADNLIFTTNGYQVSLRFSGATKSVLSDNSYFQTELRAKYIRSLTSNSRVLLRANLGFTAVQDLTTFPLSLRFFVGGSDSVRGYEFQADVGRYVTVASVEYQHRLKGSWYGTVFYDIGDAYNQLPAHYLQGVGIGVVYKSAIGALELTLAKAISRHNQALKLQFSMGPDL